MTVCDSAHPRDGRPMLLVESREEWRGWLESNHDSSKGVWLVLWKKGSGGSKVPYPVTVDEALCFGWVDSRTNALDSERSMYLFTPRNPKSGWSRLNKEKVARMVEEGRMAGPGMAVVEAAKANGAWHVYDEIEDLIVPEDLAGAFAGNEAARKHYAGFRNSSKKIILWWIKSARKPETRAARIAETVRLAADNLMAGHPKGRNQGPEPRG